MHQSGAGIERYVLAQVHRREALGKRMAEADQLERLALAGGHGLAFELPALQARLNQFAGEHQQRRRAVPLHAHQRVVELRVQVQRLVGRQGPRRGGPDHREAALERQLRQAECGREPRQLVGGERKADVDRRIDAVGVLDLGLGQRRAAVEAPVHRLQAAVDVALAQDRAERAQLVGLVGEGHRQVRIVPVAEHAEPDEVLLLALDLLAGVGARLRLHLVGRQVLAELLLDLDLDRHAVAVPARHVARVEAGHVAALDDDVLEDLVDRVADVDVAVGVRRPVVQHEHRAALRGLADALVDAFVLPLLRPLRFALRQVAAHRERRVRQVQRVAVRLPALFGSVGLAIGHEGLFDQSGRLPARSALNHARAACASRSICAVSSAIESKCASSRSLCRNSTRTSRP